MTCQEMCKQERDDIKSEGKYTRPYPCIFVKSNGQQPGSAVNGFIDQGKDIMTLSGCRVLCCGKGQFYAKIMVNTRLDPFLSGRVLAAQARDVLGLTPGGCWPFRSPLFSPHNI